jgi:PKD repeat protein
VNDAPSATGINVQGSYPNLFFAVTGAQNADTYDWNFDDGTTLDNGPASVTHVYTTDGTFDVTVTVSNDCGTETYTETITITDVTGIGENAIEGLEVYPNPATQNVTVKLPNNEAATISVYSISGAQVQTESTFHSAASLDVSNWEKGVYFLQISNQGKTGTTKLVVH